MKLPAGCIPSPYLQLGRTSKNINAITMFRAGFPPLNFLTTASTHCRYCGKPWSPNPREKRKHILLECSAFSRARTHFELQVKKLTFWPSNYDAMTSNEKVSCILGGPFPDLPKNVPAMTRQAGKCWPPLLTVSGNFCGRIIISIEPKLQRYLNMR